VKNNTHTTGTSGSDVNTKLSALEKRFRGLWSRYVDADSHSADADHAWGVLAMGYTEPHRRYHNLGHLEHCLHALDMAATVAHDPDALELAIWFHDLVYIPGAKDNEERSAEVFSRLMKPFLTPKHIDRGRQLILTTMHRVQPHGGDERFIADIDLSSLAKPWPKFLADSENLRAEESDKSDEDFFGGKVRFHRSLLQRQRLFNTVPFQLRYEAQARENIKRFLTLLADRGYA
jgi:predicted metal-dependent HD superfamily phosphohydrolase